MNGSTHVKMPAALWALMNKYISICQADQPDTKDYNASDLAGAIVGSYLLKNAEWIEERYVELQRTKLSTVLPRLFSPEQLDVLTGASGSDVPNLLRADDGSYPTASAKRTVRTVSRPRSRRKKVL